MSGPADPAGGAPRAISLSARGWWLVAAAVVFDVRLGELRLQQLLKRYRAAFLELARGIKV